MRERERKRTGRHGIHGQGLVRTAANSTRCMGTGGQGSARTGRRRPCRGPIPWGRSARGRGQRPGRWRAWAACGRWRPGPPPLAPSRRCPCRRTRCAAAGTGCKGTGGRISPVSRRRGKKGGEGEEARPSDQRPARPAAAGTTRGAAADQEPKKVPVHARALTLLLRQAAHAAATLLLRVAIGAADGALFPAAASASRRRRRGLRGFGAAAAEWKGQKAPGLQSSRSSRACVLGEVCDHSNIFTV
jgi:hypothetical protein